MKKIINKNWNIPPKRYNMRTLLFNHDCSRIFEWHQSIYKKITSFYHKNASTYTQWPVKNVKLLLLFTLTHFRQIFPFYTPWKHQRTFVCFSGVKNGTLTCNGLKELFQNFTEANMMAISNQTSSKHLMTKTMIKNPNSWLPDLAPTCLFTEYKHVRGLKLLKMKL